MSVPHDPDASISTSTDSITSSLDEQTPTNPERKHFSIERSLELERQLELEGEFSSPPATPSVSASSFSHASPHIRQQSHSDALDPQILVHIITGLRKTVDDMTKERDDLLKLLESATTREASLQDTLSLMTEKATNYEEELSNARKKMKDDEEAISLLRNKVEESRRGVMRLQAESRRQSVQLTQTPGPLDLSRAGISGLGLISPLPSAQSKRASFTPLTGRSSSGAHGHRRVSSIAGDGNGLGGLHLPTDPNNSRPNSPNSQTSFNDRDGHSSSGRRSLFRNSPPHPESIPLPPTTTVSPAEIEALKRELESLKKELSDTRVELSEANESREASDTCVRTLREFIAENQVGIGATSGDSSGSVNFQPPPTSISGDDSSARKVATVVPNSGWGFKLWKADNTQKGPISTALSSSIPTSTPSAQSSTPATTTVPAPFARFGGFFTSRPSMRPTTPPSSSSLQTNAAMPLTRDSGTSSSHRDSISGHSISVLSDSSSVVEPASPENEFLTPQGNVKVILNDGSEIGRHSIEMIREIPALEKDQVQVEHSAAVVG